jgi:DNA-binding HxlR family transcriptional regulator
VPRLYDDPCGLARALDLVGERWALLIVRELLLGPKRFTDLRRGLTGASQSMLTARLSELEQVGVLRRRRLGPPVSAWVYELTVWGHELAPALEHLARWGSRSPLTSTRELSVDAMALALRTTFDSAAAGDLRIRCRLRLDGDDLLLTIHDGRLEVIRGAAPDAELSIECSVAVFRSLTFGGSPLSGADVIIRGDRALATRLLRLFPRPSPAIPESPSTASPSGAGRLPG